MAAGNIASQDLQWLLIRKGTSFTHKRVGAYRVFSAEKGNLRNIHAHKFSGLANARTVSVEAAPSNYGIVIQNRKSDASPFAVASALESKKVKGKSGRKAAREVMNIASGKSGRMDLRTDALARASAILASQSARKVQKQRALRGTAKANAAEVPELVEA
ncbi:large subunit ribosomal protein L28e, partial [Phenoliferia sp. Uapishka_3]